MLLEVATKNIVNKEVYLDGRKINIYDFGEISRVNRNGMDFKMSEIRFIPRTCTENVLLKYSISENEYIKINKHLEKEIKSILY